MDQKDCFDITSIYLVLWINAHYTGNSRTINPSKNVLICVYVRTLFQPIYYVTFSFTSECNYLSEYNSTSDKNSTFDTALIYGKDLSSSFAGRPSAINELSQAWNYHYLSL